VSRRRVEPFDFSGRTPEYREALRELLEKRRDLVAAELAAIDAQLVELRRAEVSLVPEVVPLADVVDRHEQAAEQVASAIWPLVAERNSTAEMRPGVGRRSDRIDREHVKAIELVFARVGARRKHALSALSGVSRRRCGAYLELREDAARRGILPIAEMRRN
jgi:hypothetical protein